MDNIKKKITNKIMRTNSMNNKMRKNIPNKNSNKW